MSLYSTSQYLCLYDVPELVFPNKISLMVGCAYKEFTEPGTLGGTVECYCRNHELVNIYGTSVS